ncbi:hypothetical protein BpHYR1_031608 [Brachionus plicatilis]|uniref:SWIM-type domain-containing protein n=1 Tax=Brachionus plicatilis TaxID=10195 RepID=A0A3M7SIK1_BRAPC|nr:hypothetical protein BpHYR1_031608 [Brachionus plicatilis]
MIKLKNCPKNLKVSLTHIKENTRFTKWKAYCSLPGYSCSNSAIESFNECIKRDFTLRKKLTVYGFIQNCLEIVKYYSNRGDKFEIKTKPTSCALRLGNTMANWKNFNRLDKYLYCFNGFYKLNIVRMTCNCKYFVKLAYCSHLLALKILLSNDKFVKKPKRGRTKLAKNLYSKN